MKPLMTLIFFLLFSMTGFSQKLSVDTSFAPVLNGQVTSMEILSDGKILIAGDFTSVSGVTRHRIARLNADGSVDTTFDANWLVGIDTSISIRSMKVLPDGKILIAGRLPYGNVLGQPRVLRLQPNGIIDNTLTSSPYLGSESGFYTYKKVDQLPNGKILVCGNFNLPNGNPKSDLARYNADGTYDSTFSTVINDECNDLEVLPNGKYYVAGVYSTINGNPSESLTRFNEDGSIDTSFNAAPIPNTADRTYYLGTKLQSDGKILTFRGAGCCATRAARLNQDGSLDTNFPTTLGYLGDFAVQPNGKVSIVGIFDIISGQSSAFNRFNTDGTHDPSLNRIGISGTYPAYAKAAEYTADGKIILGGNFTNFSINSATVNQSFLARLAPQAIPGRPKFDFDGDGKDDIAVYRPDTQVWYVSKSTGGFSATQFGLSTDKPVSADYDGDGKADIAVFRDGVWYWLRSSDSAFAYRICGQTGDIPTPMYGINGYLNETGLAVFRPSAAQFYSQRPYGNPNVMEFRSMTLLSTDKPVIGDYDGDGREDLAVYRNGNWYFMASSNVQTRHYQFGIAGDIPVVGDFDGDLRTDYAVYRPSNGSWYIQKSTEGFYGVQWGLSDDIPVPADYDGDGKTDIGVFRPSNGSWYIIKSTGGYRFEQFGLNGDIPAQVR